MRQLSQQTRGRLPGCRGAMVLWPGWFSHLHDSIVGHPRKACASPPQPHDTLTVCTAVATLQYKVNMVDFSKATNLLKNQTLLKLATSGVLDTTFSNRLHRTSSYQQAVAALLNRHGVVAGKKVNVFDSGMCVNHY